MTQPLAQPAPPDIPLPWEPFGLGAIPDWIGVLIGVISLLVTVAVFIYTRRVMNAQTVMMGRQDVALQAELSKKAELQIVCVHVTAWHEEFHKVFVITNTGTKAVRGVSWEIWLNQRFDIFTTLKFEQPAASNELAFHPVNVIWRRIKGYVDRPIMVGEHLPLFSTVSVWYTQHNGRRVQISREELFQFRWRMFTEDGPFPRGEEFQMVNFPPVGSQAPATTANQSPDEPFFRLQPARVMPTRILDRPNTVRETR